MNNRFSTVVLALSASSLSVAGTAAADNTNFNYSSLSVSADTVSYDNDVLVLQGGGTGRIVRYSGVSGASFSGSLQLDSNVILGLSASLLSDDGLGTEIEQSTSAVSIGYAAAVDEAMDFRIGVSIGSSEVEICNLNGCFSDDDSGYGLSAGLRRWVTDSVELNADISYVDLGDFGDDTSVGIGGAYWFNDHHSVTGGLSASSDATGGSIGYRYAF